MFAATSTSVTASIASQLAQAIADAQADTLTKSNNAAVTASRDASTRMSAVVSTMGFVTPSSMTVAVSQILSQAKVYDTQTLSSAVANTETTRLTVAAQMMGKTRCLLLLVSTF